MNGLPEVSPVRSLPELPEVTPVTVPIYGRITDDVVFTVLRGIQPGLYRSADLYSRYSALAEQTGTEPAPPISFGMALSRVLSGKPWGTRRTARRTGYGYWEITSELLKRIDATPTP